MEGEAWRPGKKTTEVELAELGRPHLGSKAV
jgi:hypothetical protein